MIYTYENFPVSWAMTENNLAAAYNDRIKGDRTDNIEQSILHYGQALKVRTEKAFPADWAKTKVNLAAAYNNRIRGDRAENIEQAIEHCQQAMMVFTARDFPSRCRGTAYSLGNLFLDSQRFSEAEKTYSTAMKAAEELYRASIFQASREAELAETSDLYRRAGYALAKSNKLKEAAVAMERGRCGDWVMCSLGIEQTWRGLRRRISRHMNSTARRCRNCRTWSPRRGKKSHLRPCHPCAI